jgi:hypothetical protein
MNEENIIKIEKTGNYSVIANECFKNLNLSARAKGIYGYIMTLPLNWKLYKSELYNHFTEGRDALNTAFKELEDFGYITKIQNKREDGTFLSYQYTIYESCQITKNPQAGVPQTEKPLAGNPSLEIVPVSCINTDKQNTINTNTPSDDVNNEDIKFNEILNTWNLFAEENNLSKIDKITDTRKKKYRTRISEGFDLEKILDEIKNSLFLLGLNERKWRVSFDWLFVNDTNWVKVIEKKYYDDNKEPDSMSEFEIMDRARNPHKYVQ